MPVHAPAPPEDQPHEGASFGRRPAPAWIQLLTPVAVVIGAGLIAAAIWARGDGIADPSTRAQPGSGVASTVDTSNAGAIQPQGTVRPAPQNLLTAFLAYARQVGIDESRFQQCLFDNSRGSVISAQLRRGSSLGITGTPTFYLNNKKIVGAQPAALFQEVIDKELQGSPTSIDAYSASVRALAATSPPSFEIVSAPPDVSDAVFHGDPKARVIIAEFSDFQCPFCKRWNDEVLSSIRPRLGKDVALAFLHFPLTQIHANAGNASLAAVCAGDQGRFWEMHDLLFARQQEWQKLGN